MKSHAPDYGFLQHGQGTKGPFRTERVPVKLSGWRPSGQCWLAFFEGRWRVVRVQVRRTFIVYRSEKITILIEGV